MPEAPVASGRRIGPVHLFLLIPWVAVVVAARASLRDNSFLWHVTAGRLQLEAGQVLVTDPFSFTRSGEPWRTQSWLADLLYATLQRLSDGLGYVPWTIVMVGVLLFALIGLAAHDRSRSVSGTAGALFLLSWLAVGFLSPRPVLYSYLLTALLVAVLSRPSLRWTLPLVMWTWAAVHGSFVVGLILIVVDGLRRRRPWRLDLAVGLVVVTFTAHGIGVWQMLASFARNRDALDLITEWAPPRLTGPDLAPYAAMVALLLVGFAFGALRPRELWVVVPFLLFGLTSTRAIFPAAIVLTPHVAATVAHWSVALERRSGGTRPPLNVAMAVLILAIPFLVRPSWPGLDPERFPIGVAEHLTPGPLFHDDVVGGYLIYAEGPDRTVFVDDRAELYGAEHFRTMILARRGAPGWQETFAEYGIDQALVDTDSGLADSLAAAGWREVAADEHFAVFARD